MYKITVIIPIYNVAMMLYECLASIEVQTIGIENIQVICVNDASPRAEFELEIQAEYLQKYPKSFIILRNLENLGQGYSRNKAIPFIKGEYVHFLDADDKIAPDLYLDAYQQMKKNSAHLFRMNYYRQPNASKQHYIGNCSIDRIMTNDDKTRALFYSYAWMNIIDVKLIKHMTPFPKGIYEDMLSMPSLFQGRVYKYFQSSKPYYYYRINVTSTTQQALAFKSARDDLKMKYLFDTIRNFIDKGFFPLNYGQLIAHYFLLYMISFSPETLGNFKSMMNNFHQWREISPKSGLKLHPDTSKDFGIWISITNQFLLILWKLKFYEILFIIRKIILMVRSINKKTK